MNMEKQPQASIIIGVYNAQDYVGELVAHLKAQTCPDFEAILVNDGSTDDTQALLARLVEGDARFRLLYQAHAGLGAARNTGLTAARGTYALFVDADDTFKPLLVERVLAAARGKIDDADDADGEQSDEGKDEPILTGPDVICFQANLFDERDGNLHDYEDSWNPEDYPALFDPADYADRLFCDMRNFVWNKAFRLDFLRSRALRFPILHRSEDMPFTCGALAAASSVATLNECLYTYRVGGQNSNTANREPWAGDYYQSAVALHDYLVENDLMDTFQHTYRQWVGLGAFLNLVELKTDEAFELAYNLLADGGLERIGINAKDYDGTHVPAAGRYTFAHVKSVLEAIESGSIQKTREIAATIQRSLDLDERMKQYVHDYGKWLGPTLCRLTQGLHDRKHSS